MTLLRKKRAQVPEYASPGQLKLEGFEYPFDRQLNPTNRWVGKTERGKPKLDCLHYIGVELSQIGGGVTPVPNTQLDPEFFSRP